MGLPPIEMAEKPVKPKSGPPSLSDGMEISKDPYLEGIMRHK